MANPQEVKSIFALTREELQEIVRVGGENVENIRHVLELGIREMKYEIERMEHFF